MDALLLHAVALAAYGNDRLVRLAGRSKALLARLADGVTLSRNRQSLGGIDEWLEALQAGGVARISPMLTEYSDDITSRDAWGLVTYGAEGWEIWRLFEAGHWAARPLSQWEYCRPASHEEAQQKLLCGLDEACAFCRHGAKRSMLNIFDACRRLLKERQPNVPFLEEFGAANFPGGCRALLGSAVTLGAILSSEAWSHSPSGKVDIEVVGLTMKLWHAAKLALEAGTIPNGEGQWGEPTGQRFRHQAA